MVGRFGGELACRDVGTMADEGAAPWHVPRSRVDRWRRSASEVVVERVLGDRFRAPAQGEIFTGEADAGQAADGSDGPLADLPLPAGRGDRRAWGLPRSAQGLAGC
jgi:hypothetical protein